MQCFPKHENDSLGSFSVPPESFAPICPVDTAECRENSWHRLVDFHAIRHYTVHGLIGTKVSFNARIDSNDIGLLQGHSMSDTVGLTHCLCLFLFWRGNNFLFEIWPISSTPFCIFSKLQRKHGFSRQESFAFNMSCVIRRRCFDFFPFAPSSAFFFASIEAHQWMNMSKRQFACCDPKMWDMETRNWEHDGTQKWKSRSKNILLKERCWREKSQSLKF